MIKINCIRECTVVDRLIYCIYTYLLVKESEKSDSDSRMIVEGSHLLPAILIQGRGPAGQSPEVIPRPEEDIIHQVTNITRRLFSIGGRGSSFSFFFSLLLMEKKIANFIV